MQHCQPTGTGRGMGGIGAVESEEDRRIGVGKEIKLAERS